MRSALLGLFLFAACSLAAADWPTYRADAARSGQTAEALPANLFPAWVFHAREKPRPAWPTSNRISFDLVHQPIVVGATVLIGTSADDRLLALDIHTGQPRWTFVTSGPIRFAPVAWRDRVFLASDDGWLYALALADGRLLWKCRGGPDDRKCLGNQRLISRWPVRGGPVLFDKTLYFAAGIWPTDGVFLHAVDPDTGRILWTNDRTGSLEMGQPHGGATARSGVAPQGYLLADAERLYVPTGRAVPAVFRRSDGELLYYHLQKNQSVGGTRAMLLDQFFFNGGFLFDRATGDMAARCGPGVVTPTGQGLLHLDQANLTAYTWADVEGRDRKGKSVHYRGLQPSADVPLASTASDPALQAALESKARLRDVYLTRMRFQPVETDDRPASINQYLAQSRRELENVGVSVGPLWPTALDQTREVIVAGPEAVCGGDGWVKIVDLAARRVRWSHDVEGRALGLAVAAGRLLVSTDQGGLYCFHAASTTPRTVADHTPPPDLPASAANLDYARAAAEILAQSGVREGLCVDLGCGDGRLALELARQSSLIICALDNDPQQVAAARTRILAADLYGTRVSVHQADPTQPPYPQSMANLVVSARSLQSDVGPIAAAVARLQRPFGGVACLGRPGAMTCQRRKPADHAGRWTHQNADAANTLCSQDGIRGPLSMLWYRDVDFEVADRHGQAPAPLFNQGVLVAAGVDGLCALDAYNGRTLWTYAIPGILKDYDGVHHDVAVGDTGGNYCLSDEHVFVRTGDRCLQLDLATGRKVREFSTPPLPDSSDRDWGYLAWHDGILLGTVANQEHKVSPRYRDVRLYTESRLLFALDAGTGRLLWTYRPQHSLRNNALAMAGQSVYLIDRPLASQDRVDSPKLDGKHGPPLDPDQHPSGTLVALNVASGKLLWRQSEQIFGTQLAVSPTQGVLLMSYQAVKHKFFRLPSEIGGRMAAFDTATGRRLWDQPAEYKTRPILNDRQIITEGRTWDLKTGELLSLKVQRSYGCGQYSGSTHLVLFRSATLGYHDLTRDVGVENFGGMRPGCWFNAIPAGGLVLVPDASAKCACSYQMQAWLALQGTE